MTAFSDILITFPAHQPERFRFDSWRESNHSQVRQSGHRAELNRFFSDETLQLWLLGEIFRYRGVQKSQNALLEDVAADIAASGEVDASVNGHFLLIGHDRKSEEWHIWTNRLGTYHAYYGYDGKRAAMGTYFEAVAEAASTKNLDWTGIGAFFRFGFFPEDRTYYQDVIILRPATHYVFSRTGKMIRSFRYWNWHHNPDPTLSYDNAVEKFGVTLSEILEDQVSQGRLALPISSGLDSRTVAAVLTNDRESTALQKHSRRQIWAYSYGYADDSQETAIAERIAKARDIPFQSFTIPVYLWDRIDLINKSVEGFQGIVSTRQAAITDEIASHADFLLAAHWGDVWMDSMLKDRTKDKGLRTKDELTEIIFNKFKKKGSDELLELFRDYVPRDLDVQLKQMIYEALSKYDQISDDDFKVKAFKTDWWSFRWTCASLRMFQPGAFPRLPFYDNRMVDLCCSLPTDFVRGRRLQIDYLKRFHPDIARITWDVTDSSLFHYQYYNSWLLPKRIYKKALRLITGKRHIGRNWEGQFLNAQGREGLNKLLLQDNLKLAQWIPRNKIQGLIEDVFQNPEAGNGYALSQLLSLSVFLEKKVN